MKRLQRTMNAFAAITLFVYVVGVVYHHFGRGVFSLYMDHAFYYPLFLGLIFNMLLLSIQQRLPFVGTVGYRLYSNLYNAGIGALTIYSIIEGVFEIAGTNSDLVLYIRHAGWIAVIVGICILCTLLIMVSRAKKRFSQHHNN